MHSCVYKGRDIPGQSMTGCSKMGNHRKTLIVPSRPTSHPGFWQAAIARPVPWQDFELVPLSFCDSDETMSGKWWDNEWTIKTQLDNESTMSGQWVDNEWTISGQSVDNEWTMSGQWMGNEWTMSGQWGDVDSESEWSLSEWSLVARSTL